MKIGIIGDTHFGAGYNLGKIDPYTQLNTRLLDFANTFNNIIDKFEQRNVKVVILTGDIFETRHPSSAQINMFSKCLQRAINKKMEIIMVVGNHDQQRNISTTTIDIFNYLEIPGVKVYSNFDLHTVKDINNSINIILMPYRDRKMIGTKDNNDAVLEIQKEIDKLLLNAVGPKIVVGHFMIEKPIIGENPDSFSMNELILPLDMFKNIDAVVMGHVHKHSIVSRSPVVIYSGSMEKVGFGEKHHSKVSIVLDTNNINKFEIINSKVRELHEMNFDYSEGEEYFKQQITDKILLDIEKFHMKYNLKESISRLIIKIKDDDLHFINHAKIKEKILEKKVKYMCPSQISTVSVRQLRSKEITENVSGKMAMAAFIKTLIEPEEVKNKLIKGANTIIEEVEGK